MISHEKSANDVFKGKFYEDLTKETRDFVKKAHIYVPRRAESPNGLIIKKKKNKTSKARK